MQRSSLPTSRIDDLVEAAFQASWKTLSSDPYRDRSQDNALKTSLRAKLTAMGNAGMIDTEMMRDIAVKCLRFATYQGRRKNR